MQYINQMEPWFDDKEADAVYQYMKSGGWVTEFKKTREFEDMIATFVQSSYCSVLPNGTISLTVALIACGIQAGDEVIVPDYTMVATPNSVELIGAKAVFVDICRDNLCMDFEKMKRAVTDKTKAVILVTINGRCPENISDFVEFCREKKIWLIEDAAQSLGSFYNGKHLGTFGDVGSFSFSAPKVITTGQGGALVTDNADIYNKITRIRDFGRESGGADHYLEKGWNFKFTDIQAVIGIEQMKKLPYRIERKKEMGKLYYQLLEGVKGIELIPTSYNNMSPWFIDILCDCRDELKNYLKQNNIGSREFYPPLHAEPAYGYNNLFFPVTAEISAKGLWLPSSANISNSQIEYICDKIRTFMSCRY